MMYECTIVLVGILHNCRVRVAWKLGSNATEEMPHSQTAHHMDHGHHGCANITKVKNGENIHANKPRCKNVVPVSKFPTRLAPLAASGIPLVQQPTRR